MPLFQPPSPTRGVDRDLNRHAAAPPTGAVTFLFTDIEGSTGLWERDREAMRVALEHHDDLLRAAIQAAGGHVFKTVGDAFCAAFERPQDGLAAAIAAQKALAAADWSVLGDAGPLSVRMGLHAGAATERGGDYFGPPVNRVARIQAAGHGGQVLLSAVTREAIEAKGLPDGIVLRDHGEHRLKDLRHSEHIAQVVIAGLPDVTRALRTAGELAARDRIQVLDPEAGAFEPTGARSTVVSRTPEETLAAIEEAVLRDTSGVVLTAEQMLEAARRRPRDWREWRLGRIAEWSQARYRLDGRFVGLTLLVDQGEEAVQGRWQARDERYEGLRELLADVADPAVVLLGPPGCGKSTLLRRLELDMAIAGVRGEPDGERVTCLASLNGYARASAGTAPSEPAEWLAARWRVRFSDQPPLGDLVAEGRVTFLLDALNEMPAADERDFRQLVQRWRAWLHQTVATTPGNRVVLSCRSLDYSQPLSTPELRVPQVRIESLSDAQVARFLSHYSPSRWREIWAALDGSPQLDVLRSPYFLALLVDQVDASGEMPAGRAGLFTGFVRQALRREVERGNALFELGDVLDGRDLRRLSKWQWRGPYDLPERGPLVPKLSALAHAMQAERDDGERSQVRIRLDHALDLLDGAAGEAIVAAGAALAVLDEDDAAGELMYIHQLVQEYFAARELSRHPDPERVRVAWRAVDVAPSAEAVIERLDLADPLPPLAGTGWEETAILAAAMADDPVDFLRGVMVTNLALAGRAASQPELGARLPEAFLGELRWALVERSRNSLADLRDRIACGHALGGLGDPRLEHRTGPHGAFLLPPLVDIPAGAYPIGSDAPIAWSLAGASGLSTAHVPRHTVRIDGLRIGQFPVTNAEWSCFIATGGYDDERWWDTEDGRRWRRGELPREGAKRNNRYWRGRFMADRALFERLVDEGRFPTDEVEARWRGWMDLADDAFEAQLDVWARPKRATEPHFWRDPRFNGPSQPAAYLCWYEARAYCRWLSAESGLPFRLPTELEREVAAGGAAGWRFPWGDDDTLARANTFETHIKQTTPVGVLPEGDSPDGVSDLAGNVGEWTSSLLGLAEAEGDAPPYAYPYDAADGREDAAAPPSVPRVVRGGAWDVARSYAQSAHRAGSHPEDRNGSNGLRLALTPSP